MTLLYYQGGDMIREDRLGRSTFSVLKNAKHQAISCSDWNKCLFLLQLWVYYI